MKRYCLSFVLFSLFLLTACSVKDVNNTEGKLIEAQKVPITINFLGHWYGEGKREDLVRNIAREYEFENQHINVNMKFPEEVYYKREDFYSNQKFVANIISEENPQWDIIRINGQYNEVVEITGDPDWPKKHLVDFSQIEEFRKGILPELLTEKSKAMWNGIVPGPFIEGQYWSLWVNKKVAQKIGIEVKQFGMTADDFINYLKAVAQYNSTHPTDKITPLMNCSDWSTIGALGIQLLASCFDEPEDFLNNELSAKRLDYWEKTLTAAEQMAMYKPLDVNWKNDTWEKSRGKLLEGNSLFYVNGSWMFNIWQPIDEKMVYDCMPVELPVFKTTSCYPANYNVSWAVLKNAPHKEEAIKFLLAMNQPGTSETWVRYTKCPSGIKGNLTGVSFGSDQFENFSFHVQDTYRKFSYKMLENSSWLIFGQKYSNSPNYFIEVIDGKMSAREAMQLVRRNVGR
jgi:ABC-type glycerol-3-phosphate transport system substrate-binding protein